RNLANRGRRIQEEILQMRMGDQNIFTTPQENILIAKVLCDMIEPMLARDHAVTPIVTQIKAMVTVATIQHHQEGNLAPSTSRTATSRRSDGRDRDQGSQRRDGDARSSINHSHDA